MRTYYIYVSTNTKNNKQYVGVTNDFKSRVWQHLRCDEREDCLFHQAIEKYGRECFEWDILETTTSKKKSLELERYYIDKLHTIKPFGYNMNKGGVGGHNSRAVVRLTPDGKYITRYDSAMDARVDGFSDSSVLEVCKDKGYTQTKGFVFMFEDEYIDRGFVPRREKLPQRTTPVIQCDLNGNKLKRYESVNQASEETGVRRTTISGAITGTYKTAGGYIWVYESDFPIKDIAKYKHRKKGRRVAQVDPKTNKVLKVFDRIADAGRELGVNYKGIHKVVDIPDRTAFGYKWISQ